SINRKKLKENRKPNYVLMTHTNGLRKILPQINLIVKREQQRLILEAISMLEKKEKGSFTGFRGGIKRPEWKYKRFLEIVNLMHKLNKRGI
ncbi:MAG: hypothetical protein AABY22_25755, partial [Nanoarchaeota archaeon]